MDENLKQPYKGQLIKFTNVVKGWQARWFLLDPENGTLQYYLTEGDRYEKARGGMHLAGAAICPSYEDSLTFTVSPADGECYKLRAQDTKDRQMWINRLRVVAEMYTKVIGHNYPPLAPREHRIKDTSAAVFSGPSSLGGMDVLNAFTQVADILDETQRHHSALAQSIEELPSRGPGLRCIEPNVLIIKAMSQATISCLDQCLVALRSQQLALHHSSLPITHQSRTLSSISPLVSPLLGRSPTRRKKSDSKRRRSKSPLTPRSGSPLHTYLPPVKPHSTPQSRQWVSLFTQTSNTNNLERHLPSSPKKGEVCTKKNHSRNSSSSSISANTTMLASSHSSDTEISDCEDQVTADNDNIKEGQKSVIMHIISQLRLGMDLTRVTLPTFILEKRSLLEMFADFLGHPDLFLRISFCESPEERLLAVVNWYLTSIHVGRQGSVAKKPYNPIIGEVFLCSWRVPASAVEGKLCDSPHKYYTIKYRAEQVSHHPPVSAFYIECPEREMCINAHIWTKSKFMGMSVGVNLVGSVTLFLGRFSELYQLGMPSAFARSILTEPWVELGGRVNILCLHTGYSAPVIFHTKPFYGGKLHKVTCEVKNRDGNIICRIQGEWDSFLEFAYEGGERGDQIINLSGMELVCHKRVRPVDHQAPNESRSLWYDVTKALLMEDLTTATNHKKVLEDRQRMDEQERASIKASFPTKLFHMYSDLWLYNHLPKYAWELLTNRMELNS